MRVAIAGMTVEPLQVALFDELTDREFSALVRSGAWPRSFLDS
jgi:hypothetical protein